MSEPIEITRYPNRRLYDRSTGQYVTLQQLEDKIRTGQDIVVRDSKSGDDLTRAVLTQMLLERYPERMDLFPVSLLHHLLRANDLALEWTGNALRQSFAFLESLPKTFPASVGTPAPKQDVAPAAAAPPFNWMTPLFAPFWPAPQPPDPDAALHGRLEQLERRLKELEALHPPPSPDAPVARPESQESESQESESGESESGKSPADA